MASAGSPHLARTSVQLFRDCLRLVRHVAPGRNSAKAQALRQQVKVQFHKNKSLTDPIRIENAKLDAIRALSNYLLVVSASKDTQLNQASKSFFQKEQAKSSADEEEDEVK